MFKAKIETKNLEQVEGFFKNATAQLNKPSPKSRDNIFKYMDNTVFPRRFNETKNPAGGQWKKSQRVLKKGGYTLTDKSFLRNSMYSEIDIVKPGLLNIEQFAKGKLQAIKAAVHNNGLRIRNRSGRLTKMPKRQFAFIKKAEKEEILTRLYLDPIDNIKVSGSNWKKPGK